MEIRIRIYGLIGSHTGTDIGSDEVRKKEGLWK